MNQHSGGATQARELDAFLRENSERSLAGGVAVFVLGWQAAQLVLMLTLIHRYQHPIVPLAAWAVTTVVAIIGVRTTLRRPLRRAEGAAIIAVVIAAEVVVGCQCRGYNVVGFANWAALGGCGLIGLVAASRPVREWLVGAVVLTAVLTANAVHQVGTTHLALSRLVGSALGMWTILVIIAIAGPAVRAGARAAALVAGQETALAAARQSRAAVRADRRDRLDTLEARTLPLMRAVADGILDPDDEAVRAQCGAEAASLRRMLASADRPTTSLGELVPAIEAAERRGVLVELQVFGDPTQMPDLARAQIERPVAAAVATVGGGSVLITLLPGPREARAFVSFPLVGAGNWPPPSGTAFDGGGETEVLAEVSDDRACLEVRWPRDDAEPATP